MQCSVFCSRKHFLKSHFTFLYMRTTHMCSLCEKWRKKKNHPKPNDMLFWQTAKQAERKCRSLPLTLQMSHRRPITLALHEHWPVRESQISEKEPLMWQWQAAEEGGEAVNVFPEDQFNNHMFTAQLSPPWQIQEGRSE